MADVDGVREVPLQDRVVLNWYVLDQSIMAQECLSVRMLRSTVVVAVAPLAMKPDDFRLFIIDREKDRSETFVSGSA
jgi:hypothetical protein